MRVLFDPNEQAFYLTGNGRSLIFRDRKMGEAVQAILSVGSLDGATIAFKSGSVKDYELEVFPRDINRRALKLVKNIDYDGEGFVDPQVRLKYRYDIKGDWRYSPWRGMNREGVSWHMVTCLDFQVCFKGVPEDAQAYVAGLSVRFTSVDYRGLKGIMEQGYE